MRPNQARAIVELARGATDAEAAKVARVRRETINRWRHADPKFKAELNRYMSELWECWHRRLVSLIPPSLDALDDILATGSARDRLTAVRVVLRAVQADAGAFRPQSGATTADGVEAEWERRRQLDEEWKREQAYIQSIVGTLTG